MGRRGNPWRLNWARCRPLSTAWVGTKLTASRTHRKQSILN
jgi:hypothetical protein